VNVETALKDADFSNGWERVEGENTGAACEGFPEIKTESTLSRVDSDWAA